MTLPTSADDSHPALTPPPEREKHDVLCYVFIPGIPTAISAFIVGSAFRRKKGPTYRILYWVLYATLGLVSVFCLLSCDNEALLFGVPTAIFLLAWFPLRHDRLDLINTLDIEKIKQEAGHHI